MYHAKNPLPTIRKSWGFLPRFIEIATKTTEEKNKKYVCMLYSFNKEAEKLRDGTILTHQRQKLQSIFDVMAPQWVGGFPVWVTGRQFYFQKLDI